MTNSNFIKTIIEEDLKNKKHKKIITRFPPEPNGYLHIGHAKAICTNALFAKDFDGEFNLRFDDTNPIKEDVEYVEAIKKDIEWLGFKWTKLCFASDYFDEMYKRAHILIDKGLAFVDELTQEEIQEYKGDFTKVGKESPFRNRSIEENKDLFTRMRNGEFEDGKYTLRAKIDMSHGNMNMRDPIIYRISHTYHHNTKDKWCIYPMYDYAHPLEDAIEGITHSLCSLEFEEHRPLYDWFVENCEMKNVPRQIEFARLNVANTITSKRYLKQIAESEGFLGWDDPRLPTLSALRRRGFTNTGIINFMKESGLSKVNSTTDPLFLEHFIRQDLASTVTTKMAILDPIKVIITNLEDNHLEYVEGSNHPKLDLGKRKILFTKEIFIERDDFIEAKPNKKWKRLSLGNEVRLRHAYFIRANEIKKDSQGNITEIHATYDINTKSGSGFNERKPDGTIHWVSATNSVKAEFRLLQPLFLGDIDKSNLTTCINKDSMIKLNGYIEDSTKENNIEDKYQFIRTGYFVKDKDSTKDLAVYNRIVELKSSFKPN